ncbi:DNA helicase RecQ, partial [Clostridium perfringens]
LISHGFLESVEGTYPILRLNNKSVKVLKGQEQVLLKEVKIVRKLETNNELFELLRELRLNISREENVPPYVIFGDGTLKEMTVKYPLDKDSMLDISGVGETKFNKYGERFIEVIKNYVEVNNIKPSNQKDINDNYI